MRFDELAYRLNGDAILLEKANSDKTKNFYHATWGNLLFEALCNPAYEHNQKLSAPDVLKHARLARKVLREGEQSLTAESIEKIKDVATKTFAPDIAQKVRELVDPKELENSERAEQEL